jgi:DMSO reductase anchor subunit
VDPAVSIIVFTTLTGAGYGLLFWLGVAGALQRLPQSPVFAATSLLLALVAVSAGLLSSVFHLGRPERAWRAFSQWRSSWLSREGVASLVTYVPVALFAWGWIARGAFWPGAALATAAMAAVTVVCTAYIYRSLKPIAHWNNGWVPANYLALAGMTGVLWLAALLAAFADAPPSVLWLALAMLVIAAALKLLYWRHIDARPGRSTAESATGLGAFGRVRLFEAPHTEENFLLKEMGFAIARKHSARLRRIAFQLAFVIPALFLLIALAGGGWGRVAAAVIAAAAATLGVLIERWLFFAEAKHVVMLYYGAERV